MRHDHDHDPAPRAGDAQRRALLIALALNGTFLVAEVIGGIVFNSLALLADAAHMATDVAGLGIALVAQRLLTRAASARHTFGLQRAEVLGALANGLLLLVTAGYITFEGIRRLAEPPEVAGAGLLVVASLGLAANLVSAWLLARARGRSLNMRGAYLHMLADAAGSVGAIAAGVAVLVFGADWVDPVASIAIAALVVWSSYGLLRDTVHVLLEGAPRGLDAGAVETALRGADGVESVHHLHLWSLASDVPAASAHVVLAGEVSLHRAQTRGEELKALLADRFGIVHATLELECHVCEPTEAERAAL